MSNKQKTNIRKLTLTAIFAAIAVVGSLFSFPVFGAKCAPVQHMINVFCAIFLGPWYGLAAAFITSVIRVALGLGSFLAFPGSMCGAFIAGLLYKLGKHRILAYVGEVFGTGIVGGMLAFPVAAFVMNNDAAALFTFVIPFLISTVGGTLIAVVVIEAMAGAGLLSKLGGTYGESKVHNADGCGA